MASCWDLQRFAEPISAGTHQTFDESILLRDSEHAGGPEGLEYNVLFISQMLTDTVFGRGKLKSPTYWPARPSSNFCGTA